MKTVESILNGNLNMPNIPNLRERISSKTYSEIEKMFTAMWNVYLAKGTKGTISLPYWAKRIANPTAMNIAIKVLSDNNWITATTLPNNNWSEASINEAKLLEYVSTTALASVRSYKKFIRYQLKMEEESTISDNTRVQGNTLKVGIEAKGFTAEGNVPFNFDTDKMLKYKDETVDLVNKGIDKTIEKYPELANDHANYKEVAIEVVSNYLLGGTYTSGQNSTDPRGRNNSGYLNKIGNPVGYKIMRSMLVIPHEHRNKATQKGRRNIMLFIAELHGFKKGTVMQKVLFGTKKYLDKKFIKAELDDLFENVWLERFYDELDAYNANPDTHKWSTPLEIDMSASVLGYIGILLNHKPFMERCNMIGDELTDAWAHDTITNRTQFKTIMRQVYGSQMTPQEMWNKMDIPYTTEEAEAFTAELQTGELAVANSFKDFIIDNCTMEPIMELHVYNRKITTYCNKHKQVGETTTKFDLFDTNTNRIRRIEHTDTKSIPDLKAFRRYGPTGLIHGLDGNVMDSTVEAVIAIHGWALTIHDAIIVCPEVATIARKIYAEKLESIHTNRKEILQNYFRSIGIKASAMKEWAKVTALVEPLVGDFICNPMVLK